MRLNEIPMSVYDEYKNGASRCSLCDEYDIHPSTLDKFISRCVAEEREDSDMYNAILEATKEVTGSYNSKLAGRIFTYMVKSNVMTLEALKKVSWDFIMSQGLSTRAILKHIVYGEYAGTVYEGLTPEQIEEVNYLAGSNDDAKELARECVLEGEEYYLDTIIEETGTAELLVALARKHLHADSRELSKMLIEEVYVNNTFENKE